MSTSLSPTLTVVQPVAIRYRVLFWLLGIVGFFLFIFLIRSILLPFVIGIFAAYFLDPAVNRLRRLGMSRTTAAATITIVFFAITTLLIVLLAPKLVHQLGALINEVPGYIKSFQLKYGHRIEHYVASISPEQADSIKDAVGNVGGTLVGWGSGMLASIVKSGVALVNFFSLIFLTPVVAFYLLRDWEYVVAECDKLLPRDHAHTIREQLRAIDRTLSGFIRGQTNVCLIMGTYFGIALTLVGVNFGLVIGFLSGLLIFLPFVGISIGFTICLVVALFQFDTPEPIGMIIAIYVLGMAVEGNFITPRLVGDKVGLHPLWIIFGMLAGGALFGFVGILLSVPVTSVIGVLVRFARLRYLESGLYRGAPQVLLPQPETIIEHSQG